MKLKLYYALMEIQFNSRWSFIYLYKSVNFFVLLFFNCENHWLVCWTNLCIQRMDKSLIYKGNYLRKECLLNVYFIFFFTVEWEIVNKEYILVILTTTIWSQQLFTEFDRFYVWPYLHAHIWFLKTYVHFNKS